MIDPMAEANVQLWKAARDLAHAEKTGIEIKIQRAEWALEEAIERRRKTRQILMGFDV